jgi:VanZ family protein
MSMFFVFCLLLFRPFKKLGFKYYFFAPATAIVFGAILEWAQRLISATRSSDIYDFLANATGIALAIVFYFLLVSKRKWEFLF